MQIHEDNYRHFYLAYYSIELGAYRDRVRFYDENVNYISKLSYAERIEVDLDYYLSLFEIGKYDRFLKGVDRLIEIIIIDNFNIEGRDIYCDLLFRKAASNYNLWYIQEAEKVIKELCRINPDYPAAKVLFIKCRLKAVRKWYEMNKAISVVAFFLGVSVLILEHLVIEPFYSDKLIYASYLKTFLFSAFVVILVANETIKKLLSLKEVNNSIKS